MNSRRTSAGEGRRSRVLASPGLTALAAAVAALSACATQKAAQGPVSSGPANAQDTHVSDGHVSPRAERIFSDANESYAEQQKLGSVNYSELERRYQDAADADQGFAEPLYNLGSLYQREGKLDQAAKAYGEALRRKPSLTRASENLALIKEAKGDDSGAAGLLEQTAKDYPRDAGVRARLAELYLRQDDPERAREWARGALLRDAKNTVAYRVLLELALKKDDEGMVRLLALKAQKVAPQDPMPSYYLGLLALKRKEPQKATAQFRAALALKPDDIASLAQLSRISLENQDYGTAENALRKILQIDAHACGAHLNLGICERGLAKPDAAAAEYQEALKCDPKLTQAYYDLGLLYQHAKNDCGTAVDNYRKFVSSNTTPLPGDHPVFSAMQDCQQQQAAQAQAKAEPPAPAPAPQKGSGAAPATSAPAPTPAPTEAAPPAAPPETAPPAEATPPSNSAPADQAPPSDPNEPQN